MICSQCGKVTDKLHLFSVTFREKNKIIKFKDRVCKKCLRNYGAY